jgi:DNA-binding MarR family transcriptional regulator
MTTTPSKFDPAEAGTHPPDPDQTGRRAEDKWSSQLMKHGFTQFPNLLFQAQHRLGISPTQMNVIVHLAEHWWESDRDPYPAKNRIATRMGKSPHQIQRYLTELEKAGLIERRARFNGRNGQLNNAYSFRGLIEKLKSVEPEFSEEKQRKRAGKAAAREAADVEITRIKAEAKTVDAYLAAGPAFEAVFATLRKRLRDA